MTTLLMDAFGLGSIALVVLSLATSIYLAKKLSSSGNLNHRRT